MVPFEGYRYGTVCSQRHERETVARYDLTRETLHVGSCFATAGYLFVVDAKRTKRTKRTKRDTGHKVFGAVHFRWYRWYCTLRRVPKGYCTVRYIGFLYTQDEANRFDCTVFWLLYDVSAPPLAAQ